MNAQPWTHVWVADLQGYDWSWQPNAQGAHVYALSRVLDERGDEGSVRVRRFGYMLARGGTLLHRPRTSVLLP